MSLLWIMLAPLIVVCLLGGGRSRGGCYQPKTFWPGPDAGPPPSARGD